MSDVTQQILDKLRRGTTLADMVRDLSETIEAGTSSMDAGSES